MLVAGASEEAVGLFSCAIRHLNWQQGESQIDSVCNHQITRDNRNLEKHTLLLLPHISADLAECMSAMLDTRTVLTEAQETDVVLENLKDFGQEQLHSLRDVDMIADHPEQLKFFALLGRAISRAKLGMLIQCQSDIQQAVYVGRAMELGTLASDIQKSPGA